MSNLSERTVLKKIQYISFDFIKEPTTMQQLAEKKIYTKDRHGTRTFGCVNSAHK